MPLNLVAFIRLSFFRTIYLYLLKKYFFKHYALAQKIFKRLPPIASLTPITKRF